MQISFFEEFPNDKTLNKLNLINFPTKLYLADYNMESYKQYKKELQNKYKNVKEVIWWPLLNEYEGYWLSPWSKRRALLRLFHSLLNEKVSILWDAEFPRKRSLIYWNFFKYFKNKKLIKSFFKKYQGQIYTAEYFTDGSLMKKFQEFNCLSFNPKKYNNTKIKMMYSSMSSWLTENIIRDEIKSYKKEYGDKFFIGLGVLDVGINNNEKIITSENLERDIRICKELGVKEIVIYRLSGLNKEYLKVIKKFT
ncbi:hypothetical protein J4230_04050 [Candidatus Woesearchaeota archaeon]|nr:hypothetical protein [Candidatus Woesearchaeota archaeon]